MATALRPLLLTWLIVAWVGGPGPAQAAPVAPGPTLRFFQEEHMLVTNATVRTSIGTLRIDLNRLRQSSGLASGYINVSTAQGWVVRNLPVLAEDRFPYAKLSASFDLGLAAGAAASNVSAAVDYSASPMLAYAGTPATHAIGLLTVRQGGEEFAVEGIPAPPNAAAAGAPTGLDVALLASQPDHPNLEAASNQCFPMAVANSLQFLSDSKGLSLPHAHKVGLNGDDSLVGQLDTLMERPVTSRTNGSPTNARKGLEGKLKYLAQSKLEGRVTVRHWGEPPGGDASVTVDGVTMTSTRQATRFDFDAVARAMDEGDNCEIAYRWPSPTATAGGHVVDLVAAGRVGGRPWIVHASDQDQSSDSKGAGNEGLRGETLGDAGADGYRYLSGSNRFIAYAICEKVVPPVFTVTIIETIDPLRHLGFVGPPPTIADIVIAGEGMSVGGSTTYMPFAGTIDAMGNFSLASTRSVAGRPSVRSTFIGKRVGDGYEGQVVIGANGELNGVPLTYTWRIAPPPSTPRPAMRVNGLRRVSTVDGADPIRLSVSLKAGPAFGVAADWWLVANAGGQLYHYDLATSSWVPGLAPTYTGALFDLSFFALPKVEGLPTGTYTFYFGYDTAPNGQLDIDKAVYESTVLTITPPA